MQLTLPVQHPASSQFGTSNSDLYAYLYIKDTKPIMTTSSAELTIAYQACLNEAIHQSPALIERWSAALADFLPGKAAATSIQTEKSSFRQAIVALKTHQHGLGQRFVLELTQSIAEDGKPSGAKKNGAGRSLSSISFDDLELMGDNQVQETLDGARLQQTLSQSCEFELAGFSARLSTAQGFHKVRADKNPLRPEVMAGALIKAFRHSQMDTTSQSRLLVHGALLMGSELQTLYITLNDFLAGRGVAPAAYGVVTATGGSVRDALAIGNSGNGELNRPQQAVNADAATSRDAAQSRLKDEKSGAQGDSAVSSEQLLTLDRLHRLMAGEYNDSFAPMPARHKAGFNDVPRNDFSHTVPAAMDMLKELKQQGLPLKKDKTGWAAPPAPVALIREHLKTDAKSLGQSVAIEVVGLMIEQLTNDYRLLAPIKQIIANAEPAFLRLAVSDPRFFNDKNHPARRLLDVITTRSLAYSSEEAHGFAGFMLDLHKAAELLTEEHASDAQHFATLLEDFEKRQLIRSREADDARERAVETLLQAEERNVLAGKIAFEIRSRPDFTAGIPFVADFLTGPWSQVMSKEWLSDDASGEHAARAMFSLALEDILRSVNGVDADGAAEHRRWLFNAVPNLLETLRQGLLTIDYPSANAKEFFEHLERINRSAMTVPLAESTSDTDLARPVGSGQRSIEESAKIAADSRRAALEKTFEEGDAAEKYRWLAPSEALQSGFMNFGAVSSVGAATPQSGHADFQQTLAQSHGAPEPATPAGGHPDAAAVPPDENLPLKIGDWVELLSDMRWLRAQLSWISPQNTLFMFTSEGGRSHSMPSRVLAHLLKLNLVKIVNQHNVLDGALNSVAAKAIRNSVDGSAGW